MVKKAARGLRKPRRLKRSKERRNGRRPFRPHGWFGKRRAVKGENDKENRTQQQEAGRKPKRRKAKRTLLSLVAVAMLVVAIPQVALADGHWGFDFEPPEPVHGRRLFVEGLSVSGDRAEVTLRAATALDLRVRAYGGWQGSQLRFYRAADLNQGETVTYDLPLSGESPSITFSWEDTLGQAGALTLKDEQLPYPLPSVEGELCDLRVASLGWSPGRIKGVIASDCVSTTLETISLQTVAGHDSVAEMAVMDAAVLEPELRPAAAMVCTETVWAAAAQNPKPRLLVVDEVWSIMQHPEGAAFMVSMAKRARKHRLGLQFITQDVQDLLSEDTSRAITGHSGRALLQNAAFKLLLQQDAAAISTVGDAFDLPPELQRWLLSCPRGDGLLLARGGRFPIRIEATPEEIEVIEWRPGPRK